MGSTTFREFLSPRSSAELTQIATVKRVVERFIGDSRFRDALLQGADADVLAASYGLDVDLASLRPLWDSSAEPATDSASDLLELWWAYDDDIRGFVAAARSLGDTGGRCPAFDRWRQRQIQRVDSECGDDLGNAIVHPMVAFELTDGCSVGCWFCGISAPELRGVWPYNCETARLWRDVVEILVDEFGAAAGSGFLYWATEPLDNPDYARFLRDFAIITGRQPQTTTAVPLRDRSLTDEVMRLFDEYQHVANRFSLLTRQALDEVHATWTPIELLGVELVHQMPGSLVPKGAAGRARSRVLEQEGGRAGTIACVTGFLINMVRGEVRLVSPTLATDRWPDGYKVWGVRWFGTAASFRDAIRSFIEDDLEAAPASGDAVRFRRDLVFEPAVAGFDLIARACRHEVRGRPFVSYLGREIARGEHTFASLRRSLIDSGADPFGLEAVLEGLFDDGLLDEAVEPPPSPNRSVFTPVTIGSRVAGG